MSLMSFIRLQGFFMRNFGNQYDRSILDFFYQICHDPRFPGFEKAIPIIAAL